MTTVKDLTIEFLLDLIKDLREKINVMDSKLNESERKYAVAEAMINCKSLHRTRVLRHKCSPDDEDIIDSLIPPEMTFDKGHICCDSDKGQPYSKDSWD